jgi:hypothetical protein
LRWAPIPLPPPLCSGRVRSRRDGGKSGDLQRARADVILGPIGIIIPNAILGEITPAMASAWRGPGRRRF